MENVIRTVTATNHKELRLRLIEILSRIVIARYKTREVNQTELGKELGLPQCNVSKLINSPKVAMRYLSMDKVMEIFTKTPYTVTIQLTGGVFTITSEI